MTQNNPDRELKTVSLPKPLATKVNARVDELGISFGEYVRHLVIKDTHFLENRVPYVTEEEEGAIIRSMEDLQTGKTTTMKSDAELDEYYKKLMAE